MMSWSVEIQDSQGKSNLWIYFLTNENSTLTDYLENGYKGFIVGEYQKKNNILLYTMQDAKNNGLQITLEKPKRIMVFFSLWTSKSKTFFRLKSD